MPRRYEMASRAEQVRMTRERILDAALGLFTDTYFDEVTLADVARAAGVSQQTVVNHFGGKGQLYLAGVRERYAPAIAATRSQATVGDVGSIVRVVMTDYEERGDATLRGMMLAGRFEELARTFTTGRKAHRAWVGSMFAPQLDALRDADRERVLTLLATVLDVTVWKQLRRDDGLTQDEVRRHLVVLVESVLSAG